MIRGVNRYWIWAAAATAVLLLFIFKLFYPNPNMVMDSYIYVRGAALNLAVNSFPIGYSKFLQLFCCFSHSATLFVWLQYLLLEGACLLLFLTLLEFLGPAKIIAWLMFAFLFCNPLLLYLSNFIMSDTLFTALSLFWFTQLIWIIWRPRPHMILTHAILILLTFAVRYNALFYPLVASVVLLICRLPLRVKLGAIVLQFAFMAAFIFYTKSEMRQVSGINQFSAFGGWQLANNALYMYGHVLFHEDESPPEHFHSLDSAVTRYFDSSRRLESLLDYDAEGPGFYYMVSPNSPLIRYMVGQYGANTGVHDLKKWGAMAGLYSGYGSYLIHEHPIAYARYWVWPNTIRFFNPPTEIFSMFSPYFFRDDEFGQMTKQLFDIKSLAARPNAVNFRTSLLAWYPHLFLLLNLFFLLALVGFCLLGGVRISNKQQLGTIFFGALLWLGNLGFSVTASCVVLRYQIFIMIVMACFALLLVGRIYGNERESGTASG